VRRSATQRRGAEWIVRRQRISGAPKHRPDNQADRRWRQMSRVIASDAHYCRTRLVARRYRWQPLKGLVPCKVGHHQCIADREPAFGRGLADDVQLPFAAAAGRSRAPWRSRLPGRAARCRSRTSRRLRSLCYSSRSSTTEDAVNTALVSSASPVSVEAIGPHGVLEKAHRNEDCQSPNTQLTVYTGCVNVKPETACRGWAT